MTSTFRATRAAELPAFGGVPVRLGADEIDDAVWRPYAPTSRPWGGGPGTSVPLLPAAYVLAFAARGVLCVTAPEEPSEILQNCMQLNLPLDHPAWREAWEAQSPGAASKNHTDATFRLLKVQSEPRGTKTPFEGVGWLTGYVGALFTRRSMQIVRPSADSREIFFVSPVSCARCALNLLGGPCLPDTMTRFCLKRQGWVETTLSVVDTRTALGLPLQDIEEAV